MNPDQDTGEFWRLFTMINPIKRSGLTSESALLHVFATADRETGVLEMVGVARRHVDSIAAPGST